LPHKANHNKPYLHSCLVSRSLSASNHEKTSATGHLNAKKMPLKAHENILVFYKKLPTYNPQKTTGHKPVNNFVKSSDDGECYVNKLLLSANDYVACNIFHIPLFFSIY
jgi:hypothetical protein